MLARWQKRKETRSSLLAFGLPIALNWEIAGAGKLFECMMTTFMSGKLIIC
jgi:hypothetical protein